ncbi:MAG: peptide chain release factor N(5)-glutamine methyltransferase [Planctomycetota bacterium]|nr:MAG: peptide chain release factor N(5)-glutamine methyltransferase [Planctomycetota bacterium]
MPEAPPPRIQEWTIGRLLAWTRGFFDSHGVDDARLSAEILLAHALGCPRIQLYARFEEVPPEDKRAVFRELVRAAGDHKPIAYLVGHKEFYSLDFLVTPDVLIPRPETELLVERTIDACRATDSDRHDILDVGAGSGCIAIAVARRVKSAHVVACDLSDAALAVAQKNVDKHGVADRVRLVHADLLDLPAGAAPDSGFDIVVSNPPYVAEADRESLPENVRKHEPAVALFAGQDGLSMYRRIARDVRARLKPGGILLLEVGQNQADAVTTLFETDAGLSLRGRYKDLAGIDRALELTLPA